ncbi:MAG TPA: hypothetical protein VF278_17025 [Pirellulales bacterium]
MPLTWKLTINDARLHVGTLPHQSTHDDMTRPKLIAAKEFVLIFSWPAELSFLSIEAQAADKGGGQPVRLSSREEDFHAALAKTGCAPFDFSQADGYTFLAGVVARGHQMHLTVSLNTDDPAFAKRIQGDAIESLLLDVGINYWHGPQTEEGLLQVEVRGARQAPPYSGFLALDLGNTSSALCALDVAADSSHDLRMLPSVEYGAAAAARLTSAGDSLPSRVRMDDVDLDSHEPLGEELLNRPDAFVWRVGDEITGANAYADGVVIGPKRLLTRRDDVPLELGVKRRRGNGRRETLRLPNRLPAELLMCRMFQVFQTITKERPQRLAITYPSSYSSWELAQLREAVCRALLRAQWRIDELHTAQRLIALELDEASAAAFYFLHKRIFEVPGALYRLRYLYPEGFNLLLYDCGGGTTDIALVRAKASDSQTLDVQVLGRGGMRDFGGDDITEAVFHLLKAKLAHRLQAMLDGQQRQRLPALPRSPAEWPAWLRANDDTVEALVPTRFDPGSQYQAEKSKQTNAARLWERAENAKKGLITASRPYRTDEKKDGLTDNLKTQHKLSGQQEQELAAAIEIDVKDVNELVCGRIRESVRRCNSLIQECLLAAGGQVDCVCVAGNASRYPLIQETLKRDIDAALCERLGDDDARLPEYERRYVFVEHDLKHAVAKGAALALMRRNVSSGAKLIFDSHLSERLPFDIGHLHAPGGTHNLLFAEGEMYAQLPEKTLPAPPLAEGRRDDGRGNEPPQLLFLDHRWPGEKYSRFLQFEFPRGIDHEVTIAFDPRKHEFLADGRVWPQRRISPDVYRAPEQRGNLRYRPEGDV